MDFSATTLHLIGQYMREYYAQKEGKSYADLLPEQKVVVDARVINEIKTNRYDSATDSLALTPIKFYLYAKELLSLPFCK